MSEKVGRLGRGLQRVDVSSHRRENLLETNVLYSTANDPQPQMIPRPPMIPKMDRK